MSTAALAAHVFSALPAQVAPTPPVGVNQAKILGWIMFVLIVVIAAAAIGIALRNKGGNVRQAANQASVILIAVAVFAMAGILTVIVGFMTGIFGDFFGAGA